MLMPAPNTPPEPEVTRFAVMVSLVRVAAPEPLSAWIAAPEETAVLLANVQLVTVSVVSELSRPPPTDAAQLPAKVLVLTDNVPPERMAPPSALPVLLVKLVV